MADKKEAGEKPKKKAPKKKARIEPGFSSREEKRDYSRFENYDLRTVHRSEIKNAEYNPRIISDEARKKLLDNLKRRGLQNPPVWNPRTGNIVSGHQRVSLLDILEGSKDYKLRVAAVEMTDNEEREQNIFFNNKDAQGDWDIEKLEKLLAEGITIEATGFDLGKIFQLFGDSPAIQQPERLVKLSDQLRDAQNAVRDVASRISDADDPDCFLVVVFKDYSARKQFTDLLKLPDNRYVDGKGLAEKLG